MPQAIPSSQIDDINDIKLVVETIIDKRTATWGTYEKARAAKHTVKYGVLCTVQCFTQIWPDSYLKEGNVQGWENRYNHKAPNAADHTSL